MLPEPNFPVKPDEFVGRRLQIDVFRHALQQGLSAGRTSSFAILGDWGIGKSSLLLKFATVCSEPEFAIVACLHISLEGHSRLSPASRKPPRQIRRSDARRPEPAHPFADRTSKLEVQASRSGRFRAGTRIPAPVLEFRKLPSETYAQ